MFTCDLFVVFYCKYSSLVWTLFPNSQIIPEFTRALQTVYEQRKYSSFALVVLAIAFPELTTILHSWLHSWYV